MFFLQEISKNEHINFGDLVTIFCFNFFFFFFGGGGGGGSCACTWVCLFLGWGLCLPVGLCVLGLVDG